MKIKGETLKQFRESAGITQSQLGEYVGVDKNTISRWETGNRGVKDDNCRKLANALNITVAQLMGLPEHPQTDTKSVEAGIDIELQEIKRYGSLDSIIQAPGRCNRSPSLVSRLVQIRDEIKDAYGKIDQHDRSIIKVTLSALEADIVAIENTEKRQAAEATQKMA